MSVWEGKKYKMDKSEGFDDYMKALGKLKRFLFYFLFFFICEKFGFI